MDQSPIEQFFAGRAILVTGSSGFIGKVLLEKLLRCYPNIRHIYLLLRTKRNQSAHERLNGSIFSAPLFDTVRKQAPHLFDKCTVIPGDIALPRLGMSDEDERRLIEADVSVIFNSAATVKFDEPLRTSVQLNLMATHSMIEFARKLPNMVSFCHVSTAYANSDIVDHVVEERVYPTSQCPQRIIDMAQWMDEDTMQILQPRFLGAKPNTYTYTKALAENLLSQQARDLPVAIVRPSIVVSTWRDPFRGWVDNINGPTGMVLAIGKGLLRTMYVKKSARADLIPVDVCINLMIAAAWKTALTNTASPLSRNGLLPATGSHHLVSGHSTIDTPVGSATGPTTDNSEQQQQREQKQEQQATNTPETTATNTTGTICDSATMEGKRRATADGSGAHRPSLAVYHCTSGQVNPITWGMIETFLPVIRLYPSKQVLRYPGGSFKESVRIDWLWRIFAHYLPAFLADMLCLCTGNKPVLLRVYDKIHKAVAQLGAFCNTDWRFSSKNMLTLYEELDPRDRANLPMDLRELHWESYWHDYILGARTYVLKEDPRTLPQARKALNRAYYMDLGLTVLFIATLWYFFASSITNLVSSVVGTGSIGGTQLAVHDKSHSSASVWSRASSAFVEEIFLAGGTTGGSSQRLLTTSTGVEAALIGAR